MLLGSDQTSWVSTFTRQASWVSTFVYSFLTETTQPPKNGGCEEDSKKNRADHGSIIGSDLQKTHLTKAGRGCGQDGRGIKL